MIRSSTQAIALDLVGADATWGPISPSHDANEIFLRFGARDHDRTKIDAFSKMLPALILSGPPGVAVTGGRPRVTEVVAYWPMLVPRELWPVLLEHNLYGLGGPA